MKLLVVALSFAFTLTALARPGEPLVSLSCKGTNGLELELNADSYIVHTKLGALAQNYESNRLIFQLAMGTIPGARIPIGVVGASNAYVWDIYLSQFPTAGETNILYGVIGHTVHTVVIPPVFPSPIPMPVGFVPVTTVKCAVLTQ